MVKSLTVISRAGDDIESLAHRAYETLRDRIVCLELPPGALLSETSLGDLMGISRTPIREALKRLERDYLIAIMPRRGIIVTDVDLHDQLQLIDVRRGIEGTLFSRAAERSNSVQRARFAELAQEMEVSALNNDLAHHYQIDRVFDSLVDVCAGNRFMTDTLRPFHSLVRRFWQTQRGTDGSKRALDLHVVVAHAVASGSAKKVQAATKTLFDFNESYIRKLLD